MSKKFEVKKTFNLKAFIIIIVASILLGIIYNLISSDGIPFVRKPIGITSDVTKINEDTILEIELANVIALKKQKNVVIIDARDQWDYAEAHIKGAINIPEFSFKENNPELSQINKENILVIYCNGNDCEVSKRLAKKLKELGYANSYVYLGGIDEWKSAELPTEKGNVNE